MDEYIYKSVFSTCVLFHSDATSEKEIQTYRKEVEEKYRLVYLIDCQALKLVPWITLGASVALRISVISTSTSAMEWP